jgi:predicted RNA-binding protein YlxR (DUF448 family)
VQVLAQGRRKLDGPDADEGLVATGHRLCAATRAEFDPDELIRFVADPAGEIVPDIARRLPGRGVWIKAEKAVITQAIGSKVFARSLKKQVKVNADLADRVEALLVRRFVETLSLANKAGLVTMGFAQVDSLIEGGTVAALLHGSDAAEGGSDKLNRKFTAISNARGRAAPILTALSTEQLSLALGRSNVVHAALIQGGMTRRVLGEAERLQRYRSGSCASMGTLSAQSSEV